MSNINSLVEDFNQAYSGLINWDYNQPEDKDKGLEMFIAYKDALREKGNELLSANNEMLLCTSAYQKAMNRAHMLGCKKHS